MTDGTFKHSENFPKRKYFVLSATIRRLFSQRGKDGIYRVQSSNIINSANLQSFTVMQTMHGDESLLGYNSNTQVLHYSDGQNQPERFKQGNSYFFVFFTG